MYLLPVVVTSLLVAAGAQQDDGSGKTYLEQTETSWDGQTAWFTGSSKCEVLVLAESELI